MHAKPKARPPQDVEDAAVLVAVEDLQHEEGGQRREEAEPTQQRLQQVARFFFGDCRPVCEFTLLSLVFS